MDRLEWVSAGLAAGRHCVGGLGTGEHQSGAEWRGLVTAIASKALGWWARRVVRRGGW